MQSFPILGGIWKLFQPYELVRAFNHAAFYGHVSTIF